MTDSLPQRMREAAPVLIEAAARAGVSVRAQEWAHVADSLIAFADRWEAEDRVKAEREALVEEFASRIYHYLTGQSWLGAGSVDDYRDAARKLIDAGWRKGGSGA